MNLICGNLSRLTETDQFLQRSQLWIGFIVPKRRVLYNPKQSSKIKKLQLENEESNF